jgi:hypothetical protein
VPGGKIPGIKTDQVKVTRSLDLIAHFAFGSRQLCASQRLGSILSRVGMTRQSINIFPDFILSSLYNQVSNKKIKLAHPTTELIAEVLHYGDKLDKSRNL